MCSEWYVIITYITVWVWYLSYYTSLGQNQGWVLITKISYECNVI